MDDDVFNMSLRKFLKKLGVTAQREIEARVRAGLAEGALSGNERLAAHATIVIDGLATPITVDGQIALE